MKYRPAIDGLRAFAVLPVILFHAGIPFFEGGFVGVDIFFVISGYLIGHIIHTEVAAGSFSFARFYERRIRRILPAQFFMLLLVVPCAWGLFWPDDLTAFAKSLIYLSVFSSNLFFYKSSGYFDTASELKPLLHTWSLGVEEQFYLIYPFFVMLAWRFMPRHRAKMLFILVAGSLAYAEWQVGRNPSSAFYLLPSRFWEIGLGALLALAETQIKVEQRRYREFLGLLGLALICAAIFGFDRNTVTPGLSTAIPTLGAALVLAFGRDETLAARFLTWRPFVGIGLVSYSAYLWHQPILAFFRYAFPAPHDFRSLGLAILCSFLLAWFSWRYIELPFRRQHRASTRRVVIVAIALSLTTAAVGWFVKQHNGFEKHFYSHRLNAEQKRIYAIIAEHTRENPAEMLLDNGECQFRTEKITPAFEERFSACAKTHGQAVLVAGDSHAINIFNALYRANHAPFLIGIAHAGCRPYKANPDCPDSEVAAFLARAGDRVAYLLFQQSGSHLMRDPNGKEDSDELFSRPGNYTLSVQDIDATGAYLDRLATHTRTYWLGPFAEARVNFANFDGFSQGFRMNPNSLPAFRRLDEVLSRQATQTQDRRWQYLSLLQILDMGTDYLMIDNCLTFRDKDHFSTCGEEIAGKRLSHYLDRQIAPRH